jgi:hypothetical protein
MGAMIGRTVMMAERASANYFLRQVRRRRTGEVSWEIVDANSGVTVAAGFDSREEALRIVRGWEHLGQELENGLDGQILVH